MAASRSPLTLSLSLVFLLVCAAGCGADDTADPGGQFDLSEQDDNQQQQQEEVPSEPAPSIVVAIDTVAPESATAGEPVDIDCIFRNPDGEPVDFSELEEEPPFERVLVSPDDALVERNDQWIPEIAGPAAVACQAPELGLTDLEPQPILIEPGPAETTTLTLEDHQIVAGESVSAQCLAYDEFGNAVDDAPFELVADTSSSGIVIDQDALSASITTAGLFGFDCHVEGANRRFGDTLEVLPDRPAELFVELIPDQDVYSIGQVITLGTLVQDRFGNTVDDALIDYQAAPTGEPFGEGRFRFDADGTYLMSAEVLDETHEDQVLYEELEVIVNDMGPTIDCVAPFDGEMIDTSPGSTIDIEVAVADEQNISEVTIDGESATVDSKGQFLGSMTTQYGINFVDITATDGLGEQNVRTCAFLVSENWAGEDDYVDDAVSLALYQDAIDDKNYQGADNIRSLNDLIMTVLNSEGLRQEIESTITATTYDVDTCGFEVVVNSVYFGGTPHVTSLDLVGGGLDLFARVNDLYIDLTIQDGSWYCFGPYNPTVVLDYVELQASTELLLENNLPILRLDQVNYVESGEVDAQGGNWFSDFAYDAATDLFQGTFRDLIEDTFRDAITENFDDLFEGLVGSLDVDSLGGDIAVPRLDGSGDLALDFGFQFSTANATSARALFGLAPRITAAGNAAHGIDSLGVPHPGGNMLVDSSGNSASAAVHVALINQALHGLWRGGLFHADVGGALGDDIPDGAAVELETRLPPVLAIDGEGGAQLMLGAVELNLQYPGIFDEPVTMMLGLVGSTSIDLTESELNFGDIQIEEFYLSAVDVSLNSGTREVLEDFLMGLFQDIVDQSLNEALPALPIPSFEIPASMSTYGLTPGQNVGLFDTSMDQTTRHLELHGQFGIE